MIEYTSKGTYYGTVADKDGRVIDPGTFVPFGAKPPRKWQPIVTAPKDGSWLWLFTAHGISADEQYGVGYWDDHGPYKKEMGADGVWVHFLDFDPTHWMPLPEPPEAEK